MILEDAMTVRNGSSLPGNEERSGEEPFLTRGAMPGEERFLTLGPVLPTRIDTEQWSRP